MNNIYFGGFGDILMAQNLKSVTCDLTDKKAVLRAITSKTRAILLSSPENPTGKIYSQKEIKQFIKEDTIDLKLKQKLHS